MLKRIVLAGLVFGLLVGAVVQLAGRASDWAGGPSVVYTEAIELGSPTTPELETGAPPASPMLTR